MPCHHEKAYGNLTGETTISISFPLDLNSHCILDPSSKPNCLTMDMGTVVLKESPLFDAFVKVVISPLAMILYQMLEYKFYLAIDITEYLNPYI
jgi:hypothetical protein